MILAEIEICHSRPIAPTRRVAVGRTHLPCDPAPGFGGVLLGAICARFVIELDKAAVPELLSLSHEVELGRRVAQPRLRHRFQQDRVGLSRSWQRLHAGDEEMTVQFDASKAAPAQLVLGAVYAAGAAPFGVRPLVMTAVRKGLAWRGDVGHELLSIGSRFWHLLPLFLILSIGLGLLFRKAAREGAASASAQFVLLLMLFGFLLTLGSELFRIVDLFNNRMNTVFKFYYQAWALLSVGGAFSLYYWGSRRAGLGKVARWGWSALIGAIVVVIAAAFMFVPAAAYSKAERFDPSPTLNAFAAYQIRWPREYEAVQWLQREAERGSVIVEAVPLGADGRPQGDYDPLVSRISRITGLPTVLGWPGHEHQWRGDPFDPIAERARDVDAIYRGQDLVEAQRALDRYDVTYVIVGDLERRTYGPEVMDRFAAFMDIAYENEGVVIYTSRASS